MEIERKAYSVAEAAEVLRVSQWLVREMCYRGEIRFKRIGARIIIPRDAVDAFLAAPADEPSAAAS